MLKHDAVLLSALVMAVACDHDRSAATVAPPPVAAAFAIDAPDPTIAMTLLPPAGNLVAGKNFQLGVRFAIPTGWHIYWVNPGEAGMATRINVKLPDGFELASLRFPGPHRFVAAADLVSYGWENEAVAVAEIITPAEAIDSPTTISVEARWLACKDACVPGKASATITLPAAVASSAQLNEAHLALLPEPANALSQAKASCVSSGDLNYQLVVPSAEEVEFYPTLRARVVAQQFVAAESRLTLALATVPAQETPQGADGVLRVRTGSHTRYYDLEGFCPSRAGI